MSEEMSWILEDMDEDDVLDLEDKLKEKGERNNVHNPQIPRGDNPQPQRIHFR